MVTLLGKWNWTVLESCLSLKLKPLGQAIRGPRGNSANVFIVKSAYEIHFGNAFGASSKYYQVISQVSGSQRIRISLWVQRHFATGSRCHVCGANVSHVLQLCMNAVTLWPLLIKQERLLTIAIPDWIAKNLSQQEYFARRLQELSVQALAGAQAQVAVASTEISGLVIWVVPEEGWVKLNTDGARRGVDWLASPDLRADLESRASSSLIMQLNDLQCNSSLPLT
ncbi:hypothetical protein V6N11_065479 [Hibiscus sabdariffa]|uniref:Reverse transcriptase zinc-binding domain-containing protein n=1 Tax=Hibiscus sabdariffa TaxID=183260 RepID=A0ABR2PHV5_9ROSI